jgi:hypothetical protein
MSQSFRPTTPTLGLAALLAGCSGGAGKDASTPHSGSDSTPVVTHHSGSTSLTHSAVTDTDTDPTTHETGLPAGLVGVPPAVAKAVPSFSDVVNRQGSPRSSADLIGHPTVLWFYPAANTGG